MVLLPRSSRFSGRPEVAEGRWESGPGGAAVCSQTTTLPGPTSAVFQLRRRRPGMEEPGIFHYASVIKSILKIKEIK